MNHKIVQLDETRRSAVKELLENSLDAGARSIQIHERQGGISKVDLPLVCQRFATSKLREFDDLYQLNTYGFRGEAMASLTYAVHVKISSKIGHCPCAHQCEYEDGRIRPSTSIKPCAGRRDDGRTRERERERERQRCPGTNGTRIVVEDLFSNNSTRLKMMKSPAEEYTHMVDCVMKMALRNAHVFFSLKRDAQVEPDVQTSGKESSTLTTNMKLLYGAELVKDLDETKIDMDETPYKFQYRAHFTGTQCSVNDGHSPSPTALSLSLSLSLSVVVDEEFFECNDIDSLHQRSTGGMSPVEEIPAANVRCADQQANIAVRLSRSDDGSRNIGREHSSEQERIAFPARRSDHRRQVS